MLNLDSIPNLKQEAKDFILEKIKKPSEVHLESSSDCNARCVMCPREGMARYKGKMKDGLFYKVIEDLRPSPPEQLHFHLNGEPLMLNHRELAYRIEYAKVTLNNFPRILFFTNASLLTEEATGILLGSPLDEIAFSVDGGNKEDYEKIRRGLKWEVVTKNIEYFVKENIRNGHKVRTNCFIIPQRDNRKSIDQFMDLFKAMGVDNVGGSGVINIGGLLENADELRTDLQYMGGSLDSPCWRVFTDIDVMADGRVPVCCQDVHGSLIMGNAYEENLLDIWQGEVFSDLRMKMLTGRVSEIPHCGTCDFMRSMVPPEWWPK